MKRFWKWLAKLAQKRLSKGMDVTDLPFEDILEETDAEGNWSKEHSSFSGVDVKIYFEYKEDYKDFEPFTGEGQGECIPDIQAISWSVQYTRPKNWAEDWLPDLPSIEGTIIAIVFDRDTISLRKDGVKNIYLESVNEYGNGMNARLNNITFTNQSYGVSIDDIISELNWTYTAESFDHWKKIESQDDRPEWRTRAARELVAKNKKK